MHPPPAEHISVHHEPTPPESCLSDCLHTGLTGLECLHVDVPLRRVTKKGHRRVLQALRRILVELSNLCSFSVIGELDGDAALDLSQSLSRLVHLRAVSMRPSTYDTQVETDLGSLPDMSMISLRP